MKKSLVMLLVCSLFFSMTACGKTTAEDIPQTEEVSKTAEQIKTEYITGLIENMDAAEKAGQFIMADFRSNADGTDMTVLSEEARTALSTYHIGGVILFAENLDTAEQTKKLTADLQEAADLPLFIGIDEEGGLISRLDKSDIEHEQFPPMTEIEDAAYVGRTIGMELAELGINVDFAPVADVNTNPENPIIGTRAFSSDAETAAERVGEFISAMQEIGVSACAKHFPGHGDTETDSHLGETYVMHDLERLRTVEFLPFQSAIAADTDFIMAGHIQTPNVTTDGLPTSLSAQMLRILREELGYNGIIITDAMNMGAITEVYGNESLAMAVQAGADIVLMPVDLAEAAECLTKAIENGEISAERVEDALWHILSLKYDRGLLQ